MYVHFHCHIMLSHLLAHIAAEQQQLGNLEAAGLADDLPGPSAATGPLQAPAKGVKKGINYISHDYHCITKWFMPTTTL